MQVNEHCLAALTAGVWCVQVTRSAEECASTVASAIPADNCVRGLTPIILTADYPVNLAAIKMQTKVGTQHAHWVGAWVGSGEDVE